MHTAQLVDVLQWDEGRSDYGGHHSFAREPNRSTCVRQVSYTRTERRRREGDRTMTMTKKMLIDGAWTDASNGATYLVPNPATEESVGAAPDATVDDMRR